MQAKLVFCSENQNYVLCPYCDKIHIHHVERGTVDRPANCPEGQDGEQTYTIAGKYTLNEIARALASRDQMIIRKRKARADARPPADAVARPK